MTTLRVSAILVRGCTSIAYGAQLHVRVKVSAPEALCEHVVAGTQFDNMRRMARARRGGGRPTIRGLGREARRARSVALREAVQGGGIT
jgi:hypothetical protein